MARIRWVKDERDLDWSTVPEDAEVYTTGGRRLVHPKFRQSQFWMDYANGAPLSEAWTEKDKEIAQRSRHQDGDASAE